MSYASKRAARQRSKTMLGSLAEVVRFSGGHRLVEKLTCPPAPPEDWAEGEWIYSTSPRPCPTCKMTELHLIETVPAMFSFRPRVAVRCPKCGAIGQDTLHGKDHACRRWNWHGDQRENNQPVGTAAAPDEARVQKP